MAAFFFVLNREGWQYGQSLAPQNPLYLQATTACLSAIIVMQIVNVYLCRSVTRSVLSTGVFGNWLIMSGVMLEIAVLVLVNYSPWANVILGTAPIAGSVWLFIIPFAAGMLILEEWRKWRAREKVVSEGASYADA
jgi:magnesium-transporting ATPase (P-type)